MIKKVLLLFVLQLSSLNLFGAAGAGAGAREESDIDARLQSLAEEILDGMSAEADVDNKLKEYRDALSEKYHNLQFLEGLIGGDEVDSSFQKSAKGYVKDISDGFTCYRINLPFYATKLLNKLLRADKAFTSERIVDSLKKHFDDHADELSLLSLDDARQYFELNFSKHIKGIKKGASFWFRPTLDAASKLLMTTAMQKYESFLPIVKKNGRFAFLLYGLASAVAKSEESYSEFKHKVLTPLTDLKEVEAVFKDAARRRKEIDENRYSGKFKNGEIDGREYALSFIEERIFHFDSMAFYNWLVDQHS